MGGTHMNISENVRMKNTLSQLGLCDERTICVINHFSHNGGLTHDEMEKVAQKYQFITAHDGLIVEI